MQREEDVEEEDLVAPHHALLLRLAPQPVRPVVGDELVVEAVLLRHDGHEVLELQMRSARDRL